MKKRISINQICLNFNLERLIILSLLFTVPNILLSQDTICATFVPEAYYEGYLTEVDSIIAYSNSSFKRSSNIVPVRVTNFIGSGSANNIVNQAKVDLAIASLNQIYAPAGLTFQQCGNLNVVDDERIKNSENHDKFISSFSYASGTLEIYCKPSSLAPFAYLPPPAYLQNNPNYQTYIPEHDNIEALPSWSIGPVMQHETGHHFGLLHTFHRHDQVYHYPVDPTQLDHPYKVYGANGIDPNWWGRELVIRVDEDPLSTKEFKQANWNISGDLLKDTPAACNWNNPLVFPGCPKTALQADCSFDNTLTYKDYNQDAIYPPPAPYSLYSQGRNLMSYWESCKNEFTPDQYTRISYFFDMYRNLRYKPDLCGNFTDRVEFEGTNTGLHNVTIRVRHLNTTQICNVTSDYDGNYSGVLYDPQLKAYAYHNGEESALAYADDKLRMHYEHTCEEWIRGVSTFDLVTISKHILGIQPLASGYSIVAADANKSNTVTTYDIVELQKLILGKQVLDRLPAFDQPWRYIPEFIPQDYSLQFNENPFNMIINGNNIGADYLEQGWLFDLSDNLNGKKGFDGIKIGDVNSDWPTDTDETPCTPNQSEPNISSNFELNVPAVGLNAGDTVIMKVNVSNFIDINAFQMGMHLPSEVFELVDVAPSSLTDYSKEENFGLTGIENGSIRSLWFNPSGHSVTLIENSTIFYLVLRVKTTVQDMSSLIWLDDNILENTAWKSSESTNPGMPSFSLQIEGWVHDRDAFLKGVKQPTRFECIPNPITGTFHILYDNRLKINEGKLKIQDLNGKIIYDNHLKLEPGDNYIEINNLGNEKAGVYIVNLCVGQQNFTERIVKQ